MNQPIAPVSYSIDTAAPASGYSADQIRRAVRAGDLPMHYPDVNGRQLSKGVILADDLREWVSRGKTERTPAA
jgi:hypothetical protein